MPKNRSNIRKRRAADEEEEETAGDTGAQEPQAEVMRDGLEATKLSQRLRKKVQGIDASSLPSSDNGDDARPAELQDSKLMESFDRATAGLDGAGVGLNEDAHMREYVEAQLAARLKRRATAEPLTAEGAAAARQQQLEQELYALPQGLVVPKGQTEVVIPGLITGISEVQLPVDARLSSIEETERMKRKLLAASVEGAAALADDMVPAKKPGSDPNTNPFHRAHFVPVFGRHKAVKDQAEKEEIVRQYRYVKDPTLSWKKR